MLDNNPEELLAQLVKVSRALARTESINQIRSLRDMAEAIRRLAPVMRLGRELENRAAEVKLLAERKGGTILARKFPHGGDRKSKTHNEFQKLADVGITRNESARWRLEASVPEVAFQAYVQASKTAGEKTTSAGLLRLARRQAAIQGNQQSGTERSGHEPTGWTLRGDSASADPCGSGAAGDGQALPLDCPIPGRCAVFYVAREQIKELHDHCGLLVEILNPARRTGRIELDPAEQSVVLDVMMQMIELLATIHRLAE